PEGFRSWSDRIRRDRSQILSRESVRMEPTRVNFHAKKLFQPDIAEVHFATEMVQQRKLASFVGRLEHHRIQAERLRKAIGISAMEVSLIVKKSHFFRSEEHTSELQSRGHLVCRLLLEKKKKYYKKANKRLLA